MEYNWNDKHQSFNLRTCMVNTIIFLKFWNTPGVCRLSFVILPAGLENNPKLQNSLLLFADEMWKFAASKEKAKTFIFFRQSAHLSFGRSSKELLKR